jgi:hypothetical protein
VRGRNGVSSHDNAHACEGSCRETHTIPNAQMAKGLGVRAIQGGEFLDTVEGVWPTPLTSKAEMPYLGTVDGGNR